MSDFLETWVHVKHFGWRCLIFAIRGLNAMGKKGILTFEYLQHLKNGVMRTRPML